ncbi:hypothetical protein B9Z55_001816 [Caenorhabditis nigoni]|uniref:Uncharacterized protein n=1 Tax=Caenorhabditis nigoni TaxID=1611254 RepID=A0A2G5VHF9_9PELO|nr:hypothetical protein B9Z55_001816 [Caenorhabditis nigoni]
MLRINDNSVETRQNERERGLIDVTDLPIGRPNRETPMRCGICPSDEIPHSYNLCLKLDEEPERRVEYDEEEPAVRVMESRNIPSKAETSSEEESSDEEMREESEESESEEEEEMREEVEERKSRPSQEREPEDEQMEDQSNQEQENVQPEATETPILRRETPV